MSALGWIGAHKSLVASLTSGTAIAAVVATAAIVSTGYTAQHVDLDDGAVWVANEGRQLVGRANTQVFELDSVVESSASELTVLQRGTDIAAFDPAGATIQVIDPATTTVSDSVPLPPNSPAAWFAGQNVAVLEQGSGDLWLLPFGDLASFDPENDPTLEFGAGAVADVTPDGTMVVFSPETQTLRTVDAAATGRVTAQTTIELGDGDAAYQATVVDDRPVVLDVDTARLYVDGGVVDLADQLGDDAVLQRASDAGGRVLVADGSGLLAVGGDDDVERVAEASGTPAAPVRLGGCTFAAWSDGTVYRNCGTVETLALEGVGSGDLEFVANGAHLLLSQSGSGDSWAVQADGQRIDNWDELVESDDTEETIEDNDQDLPPETETVQEPPIAVDDDFGARPGRSTTLPVLLNDFDPNGDVLVVTEVGSIPEEFGVIDLVRNAQQLQLTLTDVASGEITFPYTISDGRGGTATANVTITVRGDGENSPPVQVRRTTTSVAVGDSVTTQVLGDWVDPDGDAIYLVDAAAAAPNELTFEPEGTVVFTERGDETGQQVVTLRVGDGREEGVGELGVTVAGAGQVPIIADSFAVQAYAGDTVTVDPMPYVHGGTGGIRLNSVPARTGSTIEPSYDTGTFRFTSSEVRTHYLDYVVTDGEQTATGRIRIDVLSPPDANTRPVTIPKTVFVETLTDDTVDVAGTDYDPGGGVLVVTGIENLQPNSGVTAEILQQRYVRVTLTAPLETGTVTFNYRVSNGFADAQGTITVVEIDNPERLQPPIAVADDVTVRVGDAIDIPVLDNDEHPDGAAMSLAPTLARGVGDGGGLIFVSGNELRYLAPTTTGNFTAIYTVLGPDGQRADAEVRISVREADESTNAAPLPPTITSRVFAGETVRIRIPLTGIDPDGDSVQLLGQASSPELGSVTEVGADYIDFEAGDDAAGTDSFTYTVVDGLGARATGTIRIGIAPRAEQVRNPIAIEDSATVRPDRTVSVQVLANDSDPDGQSLEVIDVQPNDPESGITAEILGGTVVRASPPSEPGIYGLVYTIQNASGGTDQAFVTITVDPDAPLAYPVASDTALRLTDILDRETIDVDVLQNVFFADGDASDLQLSVLPGYEGRASLTANNRIRVTIGDASQIIPFQVTHPDDSSISAYAFIRVPGFDDALPQIDLSAPPLTVISEQPLEIDINRYVVALGDTGVRLTDRDTVQATHASGESLVVDNTTLRYVSSDLYYGPASISFEVTDGSSADDPDGRVATVVLPIEVTPRENQPPVLSGGPVSVEPGESRTIDLVRLTDYPYPEDIDELTYSIASAIPSGLSAVVEGQTLTVSLADTVAQGEALSVAVGVRDAAAQGTAGRIEVQAVPSTRPLARPAADQAVTPRGTSTTVDVLANDQATNPFPGTPLRVVAVRGIDGASLPQGVTVQASNDNTRLTVNVADSAAPINTTLQYQVADATGDANRNVWGQVTISVQDVPDAPSTPQLGSINDRALTMSWRAPTDNNAAIQTYVVRVLNRNGSEQRTLECASTTCVVPTNANGEDNAVRIEVRARNAIGLSDAATSEIVWSDVVPNAPRDLVAYPTDGGFRLTWSRPASNAGSGATNYVVNYGGAQSAPIGCGSETCSTTIGGLQNGVTIDVSVTARNDAYNPQNLWNTSGITRVTPAGPPVASGDVAAVPTTDGSRNVTVNWPGAFQANGRTITQYYVGWFTGSNPFSCQVQGTGEQADPTASFQGPASQSRAVGQNTTSTTFQMPNANTSYSFVVYAFNGQGCTVSRQTATATPRQPTSAVTGVQASIQTGSGDTLDYRWNALLGGFAYTRQDGSVNTEYEYRLAWGDGAFEGTLSGNGRAILGQTGGGQYGKQVTVQVRATETYPEGFRSTGPWSDPVTAGVPVNLALGNLDFVEGETTYVTAEPDEAPAEPPAEDAEEDTPEPQQYPSRQVATWSWTSAPTGGAYTSSTVACRNDAGEGQASTSTPSSGTCTAERNWTYQELPLGLGLIETGKTEFGNLVLTVQAPNGPNGQPVTYERTFVPANY